MPRSSTGDNGRRRFQDFKAVEVIDLDHMTRTDICEILERLRPLSPAPNRRRRAQLFARRSAPENLAPMFAVTDDQLKTIMTAASGLPPEKRSVFLKRVAARLQLRDSFTSDDLARAIRVAPQRLIHEKPAA